MKTSKLINQTIEREDLSTEYSSFPDSPQDTPEKLSKEKIRTTDTRAKK